MENTKEPNIYSGETWQYADQFVAILFSNLRQPPLNWQQGKKFVITKLASKRATLMSVGT